MEIKALSSGYILDNLKEIIEEYKHIQKFLDYNERLHKVNSGDLLCIMEEEANKYSTSQARKDNKDMAISINYWQKIVEHKSQLYTFDVTRTATTNQVLVDQYDELLDLDKHLHNANNLFNCGKSVLVELYLDKKNNMKLRPIPNDKFFVYSDDVIEPNKPTAYIKIIKTCKIKDKGRTLEVELLHIYTDEEFMAVYSNGQVKEYKENILTVAPFIYINKEEYNLYPAPNRDTLQNIIQVNSILTNANVCGWYLAHPIRYFKNIDKENSNISINPNDMLILNGKEGSTLTPEIGELAASLDISKQIELASKILEETLFINDIKAKDAVSSNSSGLALNLKDNDIVENRKSQIELFEPAEKELWDKIAIIHNVQLEKKMASINTPAGKFDLTGFDVDVEFDLPDTNAQVIDNSGVDGENNNSMAQGSKDTNNGNNEAE